MATLDATQLSNLRTQQQAARLFLSVFKPTTLLTALINEPSATRGDRSLAYDGGSGSGFATIAQGQPLIFNGRKVRIKAISGSQSSGTITLAENAEDWADNAPITVEHDYPLFPILPAFDADTGVFTKDTGTAASGETYTDQNSEPPPVCVVGAGAFVGYYQGTNVVFNVDLTNSYAIADSETISSYAIAAAPASGIAVSINSGTGVGTITCSAAGQWWVKFTVTDSNGKSQFTYRRVMTGAPYRDFMVQNLSGDWERGGWSFQVDIFGEAELSDFPDGAYCVLWYENKFGGSESYANIWDEGTAYRGKNILSGGYIRQETDQDDYNLGVGQVSFRVETPEAVLDNLTEFGSLELEAVSSPDRWVEYASWLTIGRAIHHLLKWHSTAMEVLDIWGLVDNTDQMRFAVFTENSLYQRANNLAFNNGIAARLTSDRLGRLHLAQDSQLLGETDRGNLDTVFTLAAEDIGGQFQTVRQPERQVVQSAVNGYSFDGATSQALLAIAPGTTPENSGTGRINRPGQVVADQADLNERAGRMHAVANADLEEWSATFAANYLGAFDIVPSLGFYEFGLDNASLKRGLSLNGQNLISRAVSVAFEYGDSGLFTGNILSTVAFEFEVTGEPAAQTDSYPGFPDCPPGAGKNSHIEDDPTASDETTGDSAFPPVVLMAFSSANYRLLETGAADWAQLSADTCLYGTIDKWWYLKANSYDPANLITWLAEAGAIKELAGNASPTVTSRTPSAAPANTWSDSPAPATGTLSYLQVESDAYTQDEFYVLAQFINGSSQYRGWVGKRSTGNTYTWLPLYDTGGSLPTQSRPIFMAVTCSHILVTVWQDLATDKLKLLIFDKDPWAFNSEVDLGSTTLAELNARTYYAIPAGTPDYSATTPDATAPWYVAGRLNSPAGLSGVKHAIKYDGAWAEVDLLDTDGASETWNTDYGMAIQAGPDETEGRQLWATRHGGALFASFTLPGDSVEIESNNASYYGIPVKLDNERVAVTFDDNTDDEIAGRVVDISSGAPVVGASQQFHTPRAGTVADRLEDDKFIIAYRDNGDSDKPKLRVVRASGNTLTEQTATTVDSVAVDSAAKVTLAASGATAGLMAYGNLVATQGHLWFNKWLVLGNSVSVGTPVEASESVTLDEPLSLAMCALTGNTVMHLFRGASDALKVEVVEFSVGVNEGTPSTVQSGSSASQFVDTTRQALAKLETGKVICVYRDDVANAIKAVIINYSGSTISSIGSALTISSGGTTSQGSVVALSDTRALIVYGNSSSLMKAVTVTISGSTITSDGNTGAAGDSPPAAGLGPYITLLGTEFALITWQDTSNNIQADLLQNLSGSALYWGRDNLQRRALLPFQTMAPGALKVASPYAFVGAGEAGDQMIAFAGPNDNYGSFVDFTGGLSQSATIAAFDTTPWGEAAAAAESGEDDAKTGGFLSNGKC